MITAHFEINNDESRETTLARVAALMELAGSVGLEGPIKWNWFEGSLAENVDHWREPTPVLRWNGNIIVNAGRYDDVAGTVVVEYAGSNYEKLILENLPPELRWPLRKFAMEQQQLRNMAAYNDGHQVGYEDAAANEINMVARLVVRDNMGPQEAEAWKQGYEMGIDAYRAEHTQANSHVGIDEPTPP